MLDQIKRMLGIAPGEDFGDLIKKGAQVIDVRSKAEYASGHIKGSLNVPLYDLDKHLNKIDKTAPVIVCCASGVRSASAKNILQSKGYVVFNGGGWASLQDCIRE